MPIENKTYPLGVPTFVVKNKTKASFDEFLIVSTVGTVVLPKIGYINIGQTVSVCNVAKNDDSVFVYAADATIGRNSYVLVPKNVVFSFVAVSRGLWALNHEGMSRWDDMRFPATGINPAGLVAPPSVNTSTGLLEFSKSATNTIAGVAQLPHSWEAGTFVHPHIHHRAAASTDPAGGNPNVVWQLEYKWYNATGVLPTSYTTDTQAFVLEDFIGGAQKNQIDSFDPIDGAGFRDSSIIEWKLSRIGGHGEDDYDDVDVLVEFDIHILKNSFGSYDEYPGA